ncbi:NADH-cytochrome b5 reductase 2 [Operophtera brumata]|uniref:NADH-cytochrome b5 reductase 2 n=1 Tax=Operophtera brumata TaxID=104452 RepID=A0A0L7L0L0_OPEBR|nr:NADH-cytochrome b5 reductase 2 [Operophtera brumata]
MQVSVSWLAEEWETMSSSYTSTMSITLSRLRVSFTLVIELRLILYASVGQLAGRGMGDDVVIIHFNDVYNIEPTTKLRLILYASVGQLAGRGMGDDVVIHFNDVYNIEPTTKLRLILYASVGQLAGRGMGDDVVIIHFNDVYKIEPTTKLILYASVGQLAGRGMGDDVVIIHFNDVYNIEPTTSLPIGQHIHLSAKIGDDLVIRAYTPFPDGGKLSQYLENMKINDTIDVRGPSGRLQYTGNGNFLIKKLRKDPPVKVHARKLNMIAVRHICSDPADSTELRLIFANQSEQDILLRDELDKYQREHPAQCQMISAHHFAPGDDVLTLMCGPPPMINFACTPALEKIGYAEDRRFAY